MSWIVCARIGRARLACVFSLVAVTSTSYLFAASSGSADPVRAFYSSPARAWEFGLGTLTALLIPLWERVPPLLWSTLAAGALPLVIVSAFATPESGVLGVRLGLPVLGTCVLLAAGTRRNIISSCLGTRPFAVIGDMSYSLYLWHWPLIVFARALDPFSRWTVPAAALRRSVPASSPTDTRSAALPSPSRPSAGVATRRCVRGGARARGGGGVTGEPCDSVDLCRCSTRGPQVGLRRRRPSRGSFPRTLHVPRHSRTRNDCSDRRLQRRSVQRACPASGKQLRLDVDVVTYPSCPFVQLRFVSRPDDSCQSRNSRSLKALARLRPRLVVIAARSDVMLEDRKPGSASSADTPHRRRPGRQ